jgi:hypothetical protein
MSSLLMRLVWLGHNTTYLLTLRICLVSQGHVLSCVFLRPSLLAAKQGGETYWIYKVNKLGG